LGIDRLCGCGRGIDDAELIVHMEAMEATQPLHVVVWIVDDRFCDQDVIPSRQRKSCHERIIAIGQERVGSKRREYRGARRADRRL